MTREEPILPDGKMSTGGTAIEFKRVAVSPRLLLVLFLMGGALWVLYLMAAPLHEDEAIYAAWSLAVLRGDFWLWQTPVDKPPVTFYPIAAGIALFGRLDWAVRLPNLIWSLLLLWTVRRIAGKWGRSGILAVLISLLSPLLWVLGVSAFTDIPMTALAFLALERLTAQRPAQAGVAFALALLAKPTALFLAPLLLLPILDAGACGEERRAGNDGGWFAHLHPFAMAAAAPLLLSWAWDASRDATSWWVLGARAYGTLGQPVTAIGAWIPSASLSVGGTSVLGLIGGIRGWGQGRPSNRIRLLMLLTLVSWVPLHLLLGFQPWDRYLLPMVPLAALLATTGSRSGPGGWTVPLVLLALGTPLLVTAYDLGHHDGRWEGIAEIGAAIEALPDDAVVLYTGTGRELAWYAADAKASLQWAGKAWELFPAEIEWSEHPSYYAVLRKTGRLPATVTITQTVAESVQFRLVMIQSRSLSGS